MAMSGPITELWETMGAEESFLGAPVSELDPTPDGIGKFQHYENNGAIYWTEALGAHEVHGAIYSLWASQGYERSSLGYPTSHEYAKHGSGSGRGIRISRFERGHIVWEAASGKAEAHSEPAPPLPEINVVPIYWGQAWQPGAAGSVGNWIDCQAAIERLANGVYLSWIEQYGIGGGVIGGPHRIESPAEAPEPHKNSQVAAQVAAEIKAGRLPVPNDFAADELPLYMVLLPSGRHFVGEDGKPLGNPGWHVGFDYAGESHEAQFAWIGQGDTLDVTTSLFSHELVESFTEEEIADNELAPGKFWDRLGGIWVESYYSHFHRAWVIPALLNSRQRALQAERNAPVGPGEQARLAERDKRTTPVSSASTTGPITH
jgi:hypothetical protein